MAFGVQSATRMETCKRAFNRGSKGVTNQFPTPHSIYYVIYQISIPLEQCAIVANHFPLFSYNQNAHFDSLILGTVNYMLKTLRK